MNEVTRGRGVWWMGAVLGIVALVGCGSPMQRGDDPGYATTPGETELLNIQAMRRGTTLEMTNTSTVDFGASRVWANRSYSREIDGFGIGQTLRLGLGEFRNEFGQRFVAGGFFATARPDALVSVEIESEGVLHRVIVVEDTIE